LFIALLLVRPVDAVLRRGAIVVVVSVVAMTAAAPGPVLDDAVLFPLGLTADRSPARMSTLGGLLVRGSAGPVSTAVVLAVALAVVVLWVLASRRWPPADVSGALAAAAVLFVLLMLVSPAGRPGYLAYPANFLCWGWALASADERSQPVERPVEEAALP